MGRFNNDVVVVLHQAVGVASPTGSTADGGEDVEPLLPVGVVGKDLFPPVAATGDMIKGMGVFNAKWSGHGVFYTGQIVVLQDLTPDL